MSSVNQGAKRTVMRNTAFLVVGQVLSMPLSILINAVMARKLGPGDFGYIFLATNLVSFGFLLVEWGQSAAIAALIARNRSVAGPALGTGVAWRVASATVVYAVLALVAHFAHYGDGFQTVLALVTAARISGTICAAFLDTARGLEHSASTATSLVRYNILSACLVVTTLNLGGGLYGALLALIVADVINTTLVARGVRALIDGELRVERPMLNSLLQRGVPFMLLGLALNLQPLVDTTMLSALATPEVIGWHAAARKLIGVLTFPVTALTAALYPTLCRLFAEDETDFRKMVGTALRLSTLLVVPVALGTGLFPRIGVMIFNETSFAPAEDNLRILSAFIFLLFFTMVLGAAIQAAGRERAWTATQFGCVAVSAILDPILIPWFQHRAGNGGLGVCVSAVVSEVLMLGFGVSLLPRGVFDRLFATDMGRAAAAGLAMTGTALLTAPLNVFLSATLSVTAYAGTIVALGGVNAETRATLMAIFRRKIGRP